MPGFWQVIFTTNKSAFFVGGLLGVPII
jgi:hypothetical protein